MSISINQFECHMYVGQRGTISMSLPFEVGPRKVARLEPLRYDELIDPGFRRLLAAFETVQRPSTMRV
jgi:hypothetical protein